MSASDDYCELCDLPRSQCIHGRPPPTPKPVVTSSPPARKRPAKRAPASPTRVVTRRWTAPEAFKPLILRVLERAGGELEADEVLQELETEAEDRLLPGDRELTPEGELRWRYAARRARMALIDEGLMVKARPGVWQLAGPGQDVR